MLFLDLKISFLIMRITTWLVKTVWFLWLFFRSFFKPDKIRLVMSPGLPYLWLGVDTFELEDIMYLGYGV